VRVKYFSIKEIIFAGLASLLEQGRVARPFHVRLGRSEQAGKIYFSMPSFFCPSAVPTADFLDDLGISNWVV